MKARLYLLYPGVTGEVIGIIKLAIHTHYHLRTSHGHFESNHCKLNLLSKITCIYKV